MEYNLIFIIISILIIFYLINYFINHLSKEYFSTNVPVGFCANEGKIGLRMYNGFKYDCVPMNDSSATDVLSNKQFKYPKQVKGSDSSSSSSGDSTSSSTGGGSTGAGSTGGGGRVDGSGNGSGTINNDYANLEGQCIPPNSDFGKICGAKYGNQYGVSKKEPCNDGNVKITCGYLNFDEVDYRNVGKYTTNCINKSFDMDTMCNINMPNNVRELSKESGYYDTSAGAKAVLKGKLGDCYTNDGSPDLSKARPICNLSSNKEIDRILPFNNQNEYNIFTECHNMENHNFVNDCQQLLKLDNKQDVFADIHGFDCMPGYARAKCINKKDEPLPIDYRLTKLKHDSKRNIYPFTKNN